MYSQHTPKDFREHLGLPAAYAGEEPPACGCRDLNAETDQLPLLMRALQCKIGLQALLSVEDVTP